jgi:hypothetical protein
MLTRPTIQPAHSPIPGVIPGPVHVHDDSADAQDHVIATPTPSDLAKGATSPGRRNLLARPLRAIRGDRYLADPYPPARRSTNGGRHGLPDPRRRRGRARSIRRRAAANHHGRRLSRSQER